MHRIIDDPMNEIALLRCSYATKKKTFTTRQARKRKDPMHLTDVQQMKRALDARSHSLRRPDQDAIQRRRAVSRASRGGTAPASHNLPMLEGAKIDETHRE